MSEPLALGLAHLLCRPVDAAQRARAARHLLDWIGCALAGGAEPVGPLLRQVAALDGPGPCMALRAGRLSPMGAMLLNGGLGNVLEMDDTDRQGRVHPGDVVIPAVLAAAELRGASGRQVLDAMVRGYEAMIRVARVVGDGHYRYWHITATCGPFGAAAACASLAGADAPVLASALGHAGSQAAGLWQMRHEATVTKQLHTGRAAQAGWLAAELAVRGGAGPVSILDGVQGFFAATCPDGNPAGLLAPSAGDWLLPETSFKPWPACRHAHPAIEAALALRDGLPVQAVTGIEVATYGDALAFCDNAGPVTPHQGRFSLQHAVAVALLHGPPKLSHFAPAALSDPALSALRRRIAVGPSAACERRYPAEMSAALRVTLQDGSTAEVETVNALGDPEKPLPDADLQAKAEELMAAGGLSPEHIAAVVELAGQVEILTELSPLTDLLA
ncbi:MAG: MmgE/PrpD family protein [Sneathiellaceae bacterium]